MVDLKPTKLEDILLRSELKSYFCNLTPDNIQSMLFSGKQGLGKTLVVELLVNKLGMPSKELSLGNKVDRGVEAIDELSKFIEKKSNKRKIIIINEVDAISNQFMKLLKNVMDTYKEKAIFLLTTNHPNKIEEPISDSRCLHINFNPKPDEIRDLKNSAFIYFRDKLKEHNIEFEKSVKSSLINLIENTFPDFRTISKILATSIDIYKKEGQLFIDITNNTNPNVIVDKVFSLFLEYRKPENSSKEYLKIFADWYANNATVRHISVIEGICYKFINNKVDDEVRKQILYVASPHITRVTTGISSDIHILSFVSCVFSL